MESRWDEGADGGDLAQRIYSSQLIGSDVDLVLHGGGNTSVKTRLPDLFGADRDVLYVKGSGCDLASIDAAGMVALDLTGLRRLRDLPELSDEAMRNELKRHRLDTSDPTPSIETLLHAFLPDKFVDHTHADAVLTFGNRPEGQEELVQLFDAEVGVLPWVMPGFPLAQQVARFREEQPDAIGLILLGHGLFTWGTDARASYERHIEIVDRIEREIGRRLEGKPTLVDAAGASPDGEPSTAAAEVAPRLRRLLAPSTGDILRPHRPMVVEWRATPETLAAAAAPEAPELFASGPLTPDHLIRTKAAYIVTGPSEEELADAVARSCGDYVRYFESCAAGVTSKDAMLDPFPRVALVRGAGLFAWGQTKRDACIAADIAEHTIRGKARARALSSYRALDPRDLFAIEYWSFEQAKLDRSPPRPLAGQIALVTGAAGAIGMAISRRLLEDGAHVVLTDLDEGALTRSREALAAFGRSVATVQMDVTDEASVARGFERCVLEFGGLDIFVANAGTAHVSAITDLDLTDWNRVVRVNETGVFLCVREAARILKSQNLGGRIILNASKNVPAPGADFVAYSASKAAAVQVARVAALELASHGILVNIVHPDGVFADDASGTSSGLWDAVGKERMRSRGLTAEGLRDHYAKRNLLGIPISADHVAEAVAFFAHGSIPTTGAALTVDGGLKETFYR